MSMASAASVKALDVLPPMKRVSGVTAVSEAMSATPKPCEGMSVKSQTVSPQPSKGCKQRQHCLLRRTYSSHQSRQQPTQEDATSP